MTANASHGTLCEPVFTNYVAGVDGHLTVRVAKEFPEALDADLTQCWMDVANSGGAVGLPFIPVSRHEVAEAADRLLSEIRQRDVALVEARLNESLVGWVTLRLNHSRLTAHWATVERLQGHPAHRGVGIGAALLMSAIQQAREIDLEHLRLAVRSGEGLESFYERHGWREMGRHRNALRLKDGDDRDEVLMTLDLASADNIWRNRGVPLNRRWPRSTRPNGCMSQ